MTYLIFKVINISGSRKAIRVGEKINYTMSFKLDHLSITNNHDNTFLLSCEFNSGNQNQINLGGNYDASNTSLVLASQEEIDPGTDTLIYSGNVSFEDITSDTDLLDIIFSYISTSVDNIVNSVLIKDTTYPPPYHAKKLSALGMLRKIRAFYPHADLSSIFSLESISANRVVDGIFSLDFVLKYTTNNKVYLANGYALEEDTYYKTHGQTSKTLVLYIDEFEPGGAHSNPTKTLEFNGEDFDIAEYFGQGVAVIVYIGAIGTINWSTVTTKKIALSLF